MSKMAGRDLVRARQFAKERIDRGYVESGDDFFQLREADGNKP